MFVRFWLLIGLGLILGWFRFRFGSVFFVWSGFFALSCNSYQVFNFLGFVWFWFLVWLWLLLLLLFLCSYLCFLFFFFFFSCARGANIGQGELKLADFGLARTYGHPLQPMTPKV